MSKSFLHSGLIAFLSIFVAILPFVQRSTYYATMIWVSGIILMFCGFVFLLQNGKEPSFKFEKSPLTIVTIGFLICSVISLILAITGDNWNISKLIRWVNVVVAVPFVLTIGNLKLDAGRFWLFLTAVMSSAMLVAGYHYYQFILNMGNEEYKLATYFFVHPRLTAHLMVAGMAIAHCFLLYPFKSRWLKAAIIVTLLSLWTLNMIFAGRAALGIGLMLIAVTSFTMLKSSGVKRVWFPLVTNVCVGVGSYLLACWISVLLGRSWNIFGTMVERTQRVDLTTGRVGMWENAHFLLKKNYVFGNGPDTYAWDVKSYGLHPHSIVFQFLAEFGILGSLFLFTAVGMVILRSRHLLKADVNSMKSLVTYSALMGVLSLLALGLVSGTYYFPVPLFILMLLLGILYKVGKERDENLALRQN